MPTFGSPALYRAMAMHGLDNFVIEELREVPDDQLNDEEIYWVAELDCLAPKGYNLTAGGDNGPRSPEACAKISAIRCANIDQLRNEKLAGMPVRFTYRNYKESGEQIVLLKHPLCASKCFSVKQYGSFDAAKKAALEFHTALEAKGEQHQTEKKSRREDDLPRGMYAHGNGYGYQKIISGKRYRAQFASSSVPKEENKRLTFESFNKLLHDHKLPQVQF